MESHKLNNHNKNRFLFSILTLIVLSAAFVVSFYGKIIQDPNAHFFNDTSDGLKNYYTYAYYIKYNKSNANFEGMNYPYGEHILYTDCHPVIAYSLLQLSKIFPGIKDNSIGILNTMLLLSLIITSIILFLIFYELKIRYPLAILSAIAIMVLSPQIMRISGHYALSYSFAIPLNIYLLIRFEKGKRRTFYSVLLTINSLFWLFIHAYLGMIIIGFTTAYLIIKLIAEIKTKPKNYRSYFDLFLTIIIPIIFFLVFLKLTDIHDGRTTNPGNLLTKSANFFTVFLPYQVHPLFPFFRSLFPKTKITWENLAYIGIVTDLIIITFIAGIIRRVIVEKKILLKPVWLDNKFLRIALGAAILLLLFAMDYPFKLGMENLLDHKPFTIFKNFRANGRFAWAFYFVITIAAVYLIDKYSNYLIKRNKIFFAILLILLYPTSLFVDGYFYHVIESERITNHVNQFRIDLLDAKLREAIQSIDVNKYQAILPLPFYHTGSGNFRRNIEREIEQLTLVTSYHTSLPTFSARLTRVSIWESKNVVQLLSYPFYKKNIEKDLTDDRPFLIIRSEEPISKYEAYYLRKSTLIFDGGYFKFYEIDKDVFFKSTANQELKTFNALKKKLHFKNGFYVTDTTGFISYNGFENTEDKPTHRGVGVFKRPKRKLNVVGELNPKQFELNKTYIASIWIYNNGPNYGQDQLNGLFLLQESSGTKPFKSQRHSQTIDGDWSLIELPFKITDNKANYKLLITGNRKSDKTIYADDLLIYKKGTKIYRLEEERGKRSLFKNNHKIPLDP